MSQMYILVVIPFFFEGGEGGGGGGGEGIYFHGEISRKYKAKIKSILVVNSVCAISDHYSITSISTASNPPPPPPPPLILNTTRHMKKMIIVCGLFWF